MMIFFAASFLAVVCYCEYHAITDAKVRLPPASHRRITIRIVHLSLTYISFAVCVHGLLPCLRVSLPCAAQVFAMYHYPVSAAILKWQLSGDASLIGILFLSAPHMFTLWGTLVAFMPDKMPAAML